MRNASQVFLLSLTLMVALFSTTPASAGNAAVAPTPPMGWNSWDSYGRSINEAQVKQTADWMAHHLKRFGWQYVVIDEGWYISNPASEPKDFKFVLSGDGRFYPVPERFPSAAGSAETSPGFKPLADYIHAHGLKFGIHMIRGIPREAVAKNLPIADSNFHAADAADSTDACPWNIYNWGVKNSEAGQAYYDSVIKLYASWGVDFLKVDCIADHPYKPDEIRMISTAIQKSGRPIVLSLSPGPTALEHAGEVAKYAEMWRICDDFWDHWGPWPGHDWSQSLYQQFATTAKWAPHIARGSWPDADMLPLGHLGPAPGVEPVRETRLTKDEQRTMMTLWSIFRSPLIMGGDLLSADKWTISLLTNPEVLAVNQDSHDNQAVVTTDNTAVWLARPGKYEVAEEQAGKQKYYLAVFNLGDAERTIQYDWKALGLPGPRYKLRDLWEQREGKTTSSLTVDLQPHASVLYELTVKE